MFKRRFNEKTVGRTSKAEGKKVGRKEVGGGDGERKREKTGNKERKHSWE